MNLFKATMIEIRNILIAFVFLSGLFQIANWLMPPDDPCWVCPICNPERKPVSQTELEKQWEDNHKDEMNHPEFDSGDSGD